MYFFRDVGWLCLDREKTGVGRRERVVICLQSQLPNAPHTAHTYKLQVLINVEIFIVHLLIIFTIFLFVI